MCQPISCGHLPHSIQARRQEQQSVRSIRQELMSYNRSEFAILLEFTVILDFFVDTQHPHRSAVRQHIAVPLKPGSRAFRISSDSGSQSD
jgi:hypothetical protein